MDDDAIARELGNLEARIGRIEVDMAEVRADVKRLLATANQARGGWQAILIVAGFSGALGALATKAAMVLGLK
jgi:hypothetical protein